MESDRRLSKRKPRFNFDFNFNFNINIASLLSIGVIIWLMLRDGS